MNGAHVCDGCGRMRYDVARIVVMVGARPAVEVDLCRACLSTALDDFVRVKAPA